MPAARPADADPATIVIGRVERISGGMVSGWAVLVADPFANVLLDIRVDGRTVTTVCAREPQGVRGGTGQGDHGFSAVLPRYLMDGALHSITVVDSASGAALASGCADVVLLGRPAASGPADTSALHHLFQPAFYQPQLGVSEAPDDLLRHYRTVGWRKGLDPHPLFDTSSYVARYGDGMAGDPLTDFLSSRPAELRETHPLFSAAEYDRMRPDVAGAAAMLPLVHYIRHGWREGHGPSRFFDHGFYHGHMPGLAEAGLDPLAHYLCTGWRQGRRPHPDFDPLLFHRLAGLPPETEPYTHFVSTLAARPPPGPASRPDVSIIIPNFNKPLLTLQCLYHLRAHTRLKEVEIIVVDNGSSAEPFEQLCAHAHGARILRLGANRGFGEAINIAAEQAAGDILIFLNNDAYVTEGWLPPLVAALADPGIGAAGPRFIYPDGRLQECGAMILPCGASIQRGKQADPQFTLYDDPGAAIVDYVSAACMAIRASDFHRAAGFDLCWDPAYYEDTDLCLRLRLMGLQTRYVAQSTVVHVENATWSDPNLALRSQEVVEANRMKFASRWGAFLSGRSDGNAERQLLVERTPGAPGQPGLKRLGLYTPHPLTPGGGERYLLSIADAMRGEYDVTLVTPEPYSRARLATLGRELGLSLGHMHLATAREARQFDVFVCMGNEVLPPVPGMGKVNLYHCQFPFPMDAGHYAAGWASLPGYAAVLVNSQFTRSHVLREAGRLGLPPVPVHVVHPPVPQVVPGARAGEGAAIILHAGRFAPGGHGKRQDMMIAAFAETLSRATGPVELHMAGALGVDDAARSHLIELRRAARGLPVSFHVNARADQLHALYRRATVYWHLTGAADDVALHPERFEHFGITIAEAMSAGAIPVVLRHGGPAEILVDGHSGFLVDGVPGLVARTLELLGDTQGRRDEIGRQAKSRAARFSPAAFKAALKAALGTVARRDLSHSISQRLPL